MKEPDIQTKSWRYLMATTCVVFIVWLIYAIVRYIIARGTGMEHFPLFVLNKVFSSTAAVLIGLSFFTDVLSRWKKYWPIPPMPIRKYFGLVGYAFASVHAIMAVLVMKPSYFHEFHDGEERLNVYGETAMFFGIVTFVLFGMVSIASIPSVSASLTGHQRNVVGNIGYAGFMTLMLHIGTLGIRQWLEPATWPGGIVPISLSVFSVLFLILIVKGVYEMMYR